MNKVLGFAVFLVSTLAHAGNEGTWDPYFQVKEALVRESYKCVTDLSRAGKDGMAWNYCVSKKKDHPATHLGAKSDLSDDPVFRSGWVSTAEKCEGPQGIEGLLVYGLMNGGWECNLTRNGWLCEGETHAYKLGLHVLPVDENATEQCQIRFNKI